MQHRFVLAVLFLLLALSAAAQTTYEVTPQRGPVTGGTLVTIKGGTFGPFSYGVIFGMTSVPATRVDATTLIATTPAHLPGTVPVDILESDIVIPTGKTFTFEGEATDAFERILLPYFTRPVRGAFGSEFRTDLHAALKTQTPANIFGLHPFCFVTCINDWYTPYELTAQYPFLEPSHVDPTGAPGAFLYIRKSENAVAMNLRAYDVSRAAQNFGTELPIVRTSEFTKDYDTILLIGVPSDPLFRKTLRIYNAGEAELPYIIQIESARGVEAQHEVLLPARNGLFVPGYLEFSDFPSNVPGRMRVMIAPVTPPISAPLEWPDRWAFITVTNNETQTITTITPQP